MGLWTGILTILGCAVAGLVIGVIIFYIFRQIRNKKVALIHRENDATNYESTNLPLASKQADKVIKSNGAGETPEILINSHVHNAILKGQTQFASAEINRVQEGIKQNVPIVEKSEGPSRTGAIHWTELFKQSGAMSSEEKQQPVEHISLKETPPVNQKDGSVVEERSRSVTQNLSNNAEITKRRIIPEEKRPKELAKSGTTDGAGTIKTSGTSEVNKAKQDQRPVTPHKPVIINQKNTPKVDKYKEATDSNIPLKSVAQKQEKAPVIEKSEAAPRSDFIEELKANLVVATTPWADKLLPFQTGCWDTNHGEGESLLIAHYQDLIQLYVDIGLANNIVWLATEMGHRSKELDDSYIKLCVNIAEKIKWVIASLAKSS